MKNIRTTLAALLVIGGAVVASAQNPATPARGQRGMAGARGVAGPGRGRGMDGALLKGITLSDAEKANLKNVRAKYASQMKTLREQYKPQHQAMRDARQKSDSAALRDLWSKSTAEREQMKHILDAQHADVRAALSPANQTKFDANFAKVEKRLAARGNKAGKSGPHRPGFNGPAK